MLHLLLGLASLNVAGARSAMVFLPLYALHLGAQPVVVGMLAATFSILPMVLSVPVGRISDRYGARAPLIVGSAIGGLALLVPYGTPGLPAIFMAVALMGLSEGIYTVLVQNAIGQMGVPEDRGRNFANYALARSVGNFVGPLVAGFAIDLVGYQTTCLILAALALAPIPGLLLYGARLPAAPRTRSRKESVSDVLAAPGVLRVLAMSSLLNAGRDMFQFYLPVYAHSIGLPASVIGIVLAACSVSAFVVRTILPRLIARYREERVLAYAFIVGAASLVLIPLVQSAWALTGIAFLFGLGMGCGQPVVSVLMFNSSPSGRSGEGMGLRMTINYLTRLVAPVAFGSVGTAFGIATMFWTNALMLGSGALISGAARR